MAGEVRMQIYAESGDSEGGENVDLGGERGSEGGENADLGDGRGSEE